MTAIPHSGEVLACPAGVLLPAALADIAALRALLEPLPVFLGGGTGLAIALGHRQSDDFDFFFAANTINIDNLFSQLTPFIREVTARQNDTLNFFSARGTKFQFLLDYSAGWYAPPHRCSLGFSVLQPREIGLMKLLALMNRGCRKDFIDLYELDRSAKAPLQQLLTALPAKYPALSGDNVHLGKAMTYFADAEREPMPNMLAGHEIDWDRVRRFFIATATGAFR